MKKILLIILDFALNLAVIFILVFVIQSWIIAPFDVAGASMCDTLNNINEECTNEHGEKIIINEALYLFGAPQRGDIVVFHLENDPDKFYIKRIIGLPGEKVEIKNGKVFITPANNDKMLELKETYLNEENKGNTNLYFTDQAIFEVPESHYFVLGDNRNKSTDSRTCFATKIIEDCTKSKTAPYVEEDLIRGKAWVVWWPLQNIRIMDPVNY